MGDEAVMDEEIKTLLNQLDGHLGLAVYRSEGSDERWKQESSAYISQIRKVLKDGKTDDPPITPSGYPDWLAVVARTAKDLMGTGAEKARCEIVTKDGLRIMVGVGEWDTIEDDDDDD